MTSNMWLYIRKMGPPPHLLPTLCFPLNFVPEEYFHHSTDKSDNGDNHAFGFLTANVFQSRKLRYVSALIRRPLLPILQMLTGDQLSSILVNPSMSQISTANRDYPSVALESAPRAEDMKWPQTQPARKGSHRRSC